ncbi:hypothetical protein [Virgisporangium ochraceum]|uniref:Uncharacterized protein n=1 Tax=Virgisporangium ochraceum TaxID=65505 RepID=A0A8J4A0U9_9ACTN|nr:hypothetical protein [Virgisporangium ochraceum]GIJ72517.1 hypothetical protein Voc01_074340 [Virgisporangium ochraceum]
MALFGAAAATAGAGAALLVRLARRPVRPGAAGRRRIGVGVASLGLAAGSAALVMVAFEATLVAGLLLLAVAPAAVLGGWTLAGSAIERPPVPAAGIRVAVAATALFPVAALASIGFVAGSGADYVRRYGHPVTVDTKHDCVTHAGSDRSVCTVRYVVDRRHHTASISLHVDGSTPRFLDVVALDGRAVERDGPVSPTVGFGRRVPGWLVITVPVEAVLLLLLLGRAAVTAVRGATDGGSRASRPGATVAG